MSLSCSDIPLDLTDRFVATLRRWSDEYPKRAKHCSLLALVVGMPPPIRPDEFLVRVSDVGRLCGDTIAGIHSSDPGLLLVQSYVRAVLYCTSIQSISPFAWQDGPILPAF